MKIENANMCEKWAKDLCNCNYLKDCELNKQQPETITLDGETFVHNPDSKQRIDIVQPLNPNANAIKIVSDRINYYGNKGATSKAGENKDFAIWNELQHILKLLQS